MVEFSRYELSQFEELEQQISDRKGLHEDCNGCQSIKRLLVYSEQFGELIDEMDEDFSEFFDNHQNCIQLVSKLSLDALEDIYVSIHHRQYTSGYRGYRYLFETLLLLRGLNREPEKSAEIYTEFSDELSALVGGPSSWPRFPYEHIDQLGSIKDSQRDLIKQETEELDGFYHRLSEVGNHPLRLDRAYIQGQHHPSFELDVAGLALWTLIGVMSEYILSFDEEDFPQRFAEVVDETAQEITKFFDMEPPVFLSRYYGLVPEK